MFSTKCDNDPGVTCIQRCRDASKHREDPIVFWWDNSRFVYGYTTGIDRWVSYGFLWTDGIAEWDLFWIPLQPQVSCRYWNLKAVKSKCHMDFANLFAIVKKRRLFHESWNLWSFNAVCVRVVFCKHLLDNYNAALRPKAVGYWDVLLLLCAFTTMLCVLWVLCRVLRMYFWKDQLNNYDVPDGAAVCCCATFQFQPSWS